MSHDQLISDYLAGPKLLREAIAGMTREQIDAAPISGKWSTRQVICHLADFDLICADRIKRIIAEDQPLMFNGDPDLFAAQLAYGQRDIENELNLIDTVRRQVAAILRSVPAETFHRIGNHSTDGPLTLETLLTRITRHIPHHVQKIRDKRAALG